MIDRIVSRLEMREQLGLMLRLLGAAGTQPVDRPARRHTESTEPEAGRPEPEAAAPIAAE
jgi:hypothetical protein